MSENGDVPKWVERMRAAGYVVTPATRDTLPDPEHVLPARVSFLRYCLSRLWRLLRSHRSPRPEHARIP
jgi:hypothetical protein